jgi:alpha-galactosidase
MSVTFAQLGVTGMPAVRDLWHRADVTGMTGALSASVPGGAALIYTLSPPATTGTGGAGGDGGAGGAGGTAGGGGQPGSGGAGGTADAGGAVGAGGTTGTGAGGHGGSAAGGTTGGGASSGGGCGCDVAARPDLRLPWLLGCLALAVAGIRWRSSRRSTRPSWPSTIPDR